MHKLKWYHLDTKTTETLHDL